MPDPLAVLYLQVPEPSSCPYCGPPGTWTDEATLINAARVVLQHCSCRAYQMMVDRGWTRNSMCCIKPDLKQSCCPQYTIKLDALQFKASKSQQKLINRFNRWILYGNVLDDGKVTHQSSIKSRRQEPFSLINAIHYAESELHPTDVPAHIFEVTLEPASYTEEKYALYEDYMINVHMGDGGTSASFIRHLVDNPLEREDIPYTKDPSDHLPRQYGTYHQLYRIDGKLVAMGTIDILTNSVSSYFFVYDTDWDRFSLGRLSVLREIALAKEMYDSGLQEMQYLHLGFYVHGCPKMKYKGDYAPSYLLDPEDYSLHPIEEYRPFLDNHTYVSFAHVGQSDQQPSDDTAVIPASLLDGLTLHVDDISPAVPAINVFEWNDSKLRSSLIKTINELGPQLSKQVIVGNSWL